MFVGYIGTSVCAIPWGVRFSRVLTQTGKLGFLFSPKEYKYYDDIRDFKQEPKKIATFKCKSNDNIIRKYVDGNIWPHADTSVHSVITVNNKIKYISSSVEETDQVVYDITCDHAFHYGFGTLISIPVGILAIQSLF